MTTDEAVRFRTVTRARFLAMSPGSQEACLRDLYADNLQRLFKALVYCQHNHIRLYRMLCGVFPLNDEPVGDQVLNSFSNAARHFGLRAEAAGVRVLMHPDQFVVLNSEKPEVVRQSVRIVARHARVFDLLGLPESTWSTLILHGGKAGRSRELVNEITALPSNVRSRLALENDEHAYSAQAIMEICEQAKVPMVFDPHHHVVKEKLETYAHPSIADYVRLARGTWPNPDWQLAHVSNGAAFFRDSRHSELITDFPPALFAVPWVEVEAKAKQDAIFDLRRRWPTLA